MSLDNLLVAEVSLRDSVLFSLRLAGASGAAAKDKFRAGEFASLASFAIAFLRI